ncbi:MAG: hypothetical protein J6I46_12130 [Ruminococcus sp.]|nr:hypothetical protein [Ruminococcus sp.]
MNNETNINSKQENAKKPKNHGCLFGCLGAVLLILYMLFYTVNFARHVYAPDEIKWDTFDAEKISQIEDKMHLDMPDDAEFTKFTSWIGWDGGGYMILGMTYEGKPDDFIDNSFKGSDHTDLHKYESQDPEFQSYLSELTDDDLPIDQEGYVTEFDLIYTCHLERTEEHSSGNYIIGFKEENGNTAVKLLFNKYDA